MININNYEIYIYEDYERDEMMIILRDVTTNKFAPIIDGWVYQKYDYQDMIEDYITGEDKDPLYKEILDTVSKEHLWKDRPDILTSDAWFKIFPAQPE